MLATPLLIGLIAPGFTGDKRDLTIVLVQILFPGAGLLVISAWCLGILNSHRKFLLSYSAPIVWNLAIIVALVLEGGTRRARRRSPWPPPAPRWSGSALQLVVQLPTVFRLVPRIAPSLGRGSEHVRTVIRNFVPVFVGRGVVQISAYVDTMIASFLPGGAVAALASAQVLYTLPVSLFGMAVSAAELPAMSSVAGERDEIAAALRTRLERGLRRIAFFVLPSGIAFIALGDIVAGALFQTGRFTHADTMYVWGILAGSAVGLLASTLGRLYARRITRCATRVRRSGSRRFASCSRWCWGCCSRSPSRGCSASTPRGAPPASPRRRASPDGWSSRCLRRGLNARIGRTGLPMRFTLQLELAAAAGAAVAWASSSPRTCISPCCSPSSRSSRTARCTSASRLAMAVPEARDVLARVTRRR